ncbi:MAG: AraC family transcriptional regulator [Gemmataceae bacterium]|nr:AraC family transcriptional regulator [Gemmataceae bacterium]
MARMLFQRDPRPALRPFVKTLWAADLSSLWNAAPAARERLLPSGDMHLAFRLSDQPVRIFESVDDVHGHTVGHAVIGGARAGFYVKETREPACSVGAVLRPGAAEALLGDSADAFSGRHVALDDVWGRSAVAASERLFEARGLERRLDVLESILAARLPPVRGLHPAVAQALGQLLTTPDVRAAVKQSGYSHRRFIVLFRRAVGLTPKLYCRLLRFRRTIDRVKAGRVESWAGLALAAGYSDQAHFHREFREFAGVTPEEYRKIAPRWPMHVPVLDLSRSSG